MRLASGFANPARVLARPQAGSDAARHCRAEPMELPFAHPRRGVSGGCAAPTGGKARVSVDTQRETMDTRYLIETRRRARGAVRPTYIAIIAVIVLLAIGAWFLIIKPHQELVMADSGGHPSTPIATVKRAAPPPVNV